MSDVSTTPTPDALATVAFPTGGSAPNTPQIGGQPPLVLGPGTPTANAAPDVLIAGGGNETLWGAGTQGDTTFWAGDGADELVGGSGDNTFVAGAGMASMVAGGGANLLVRFNGLAGGTVDVAGWNRQDHHIEREGYGANTRAEALASAMATGGGTTPTKSDDTRITFAGLQGVSPSWLVAS